MTADNNSPKTDAIAITTASCRSPFSYPAPSYRVASIDFTSKPNATITLECLQTGTQYKTTLYEICADPDFIKTIDAESCYRLGYMKGLQSARNSETNLVKPR
jgi:hypothetical protein